MSSEYPKGAAAASAPGPSPLQTMPDGPPPIALAETVPCTSCWSARPWMAGCGLPA